MRAASTAPPGPLRRAVAGTGSLLLLVVLVGGLPLALVGFAGNPLPAAVPAVDDVRTALFSVDDGSLFLAVLTVVGWVAWASFSGSVVLELLARLRHRRARSIPGLRGQQRFAGILIAAVGARAAPPAVTTPPAAPPGAPTTAPVTTPAYPAADQPVTRGLGPGAPSGQPLQRGLGAAESVVLHLVDRGEGLLDLQDRYGVPWQRIAEANYGVSQPDGRTLERGQTRIYAGWQLRIPAPATVTGFGAAGDQAGRAGYEYEVAKGDWMWHIADRYLGDPERYDDIAELNPRYADEHGDFPDHIEPGWTLQLPDDAVDSGPGRHATGTATGPEPAPPPPEPAPPEPAPPPPVEPEAPAAESAPPAPDPVVTAPAPDPASTGLGSAPAQPADGFTTGGEPDPERLAPALLAGAGLLAALVLGAAAYHRRRRHQHQRPGERPASAPAQRLEKALRSAQQPLDTARLDAALRHLAAGLRGRTGPAPDVAGILVEVGTVHVLLASPGTDPPEPWRDNGDRWTLLAGQVLPPPDGSVPPAPLPALAAIGSQAGIHLLLDLERLGLLSIHGDPSRALDLLRYLAAELACNTWSDTTEVLVAGFDPREAELLAALDRDRVRSLPSVADVVAMLRKRVASARAAPGQTGWVPLVVLAAAATDAELAALAALEPDLGGVRCAVAVAVADPAPPSRHDAWRITVTPDGAVHVRMPFLRASMSAAALSVMELVPLAATMRLARGGTQELVPVGQATDPPGRPALETDPGLGAYPDREPDPDLETDLRAWHERDPGRPRIGVLGPVIVEAPGPPPDTRQRLHAELVVYLAQRGRQGANAKLLDAALWPDVTVTEPTRQRAISRVRRWLGTDPTGAPWLPDVDTGPGYRLADGCLFDWHLFRRLRTRGEVRGPGGAADLRAALELVRGVPLDGADRPQVPGTRNPYPWLAESDIYPDHVVAIIVDTAHRLAERYLAAGEPAGARWAVHRAWLADVHRSYDEPWRDLLRAEHADGHPGRLRAVLAELMAAREAEAPEDLAPETYRLISTWPAHLLVPAG